MTLGGFGIGDPAQTHRIDWHRLGAAGHRRDISSKAQVVQAIDEHGRSVANWLAQHAKNKGGKEGLFCPVCVAEQTTWTCAGKLQVANQVVLAPLTRNRVALGHERVDHSSTGAPVVPGAKLHQ